MRLLEISLKVAPPSLSFEELRDRFEVVITDPKDFIMKSVDL